MGAPLVVDAVVADAVIDVLIAVDEVVVVLFFVDDAVVVFVTATFQ